MFDSLSTLGTLLKQIISHFHFIRLCGYRYCSPSLPSCT